MISAQRAGWLLERFATLRVLVAGDLMLDEFLWGKVTRISPEAPVPVVKVTEQSYFAGGAANVARNLAEFAGGVGVTGLCGADEAGRVLKGLLRDGGIAVDGILADAERPTILKTRVIARHQQVVRIDRESPMAPTGQQREEFLTYLGGALASYDALILSDYAKGFLGAELCGEVCRLARGLGRIVTVDPSPRNPIRWAGVTAVKPNLEEARAAAGLPETAAVEETGPRLMELWDTEMVLVTMGEQGMELFARGGGGAYHTPTRAREVFDVSGAGDTAIAVFTLALVAGATGEEAAELANHASGVAVGKLGTATVSRAEVLESVVRG